MAIVLTDPGGPGPGSPEALFAARLLADPSGPLVTYYDDATGERAELSAKSLANWVAKTHFLLTDSLGLAPGELAVVRLPVHWLAAPILLGCWFAGLQVSTEPDPDAAVAFGDAASLAELAAESGRPGTVAGLADEVFAVSLLSFARPDVAPEGAQDFSTAVRPMPDAWAAVRALAGPNDLALAGSPALTGSPALSRRELAQVTVARAVGLGLAPSGRLLWTGTWDDSFGWIDALLAPLVMVGSVVLVRNPEPEKCLRHAEDEQVTVRH